MEYLERHIVAEMLNKLMPNKAVLLFGARRTGKTVAVRQLVEKVGGSPLILNGEDADVRAMLDNCSVSNYKRLLEGKDLLVIDEAQHVDEIGKKLKLIVDEVPNIRVVASGSSSFDLKNQAGEPLVGRASQFLLTAFSQEELSGRENLLTTRQNLESRLLYGSYPDVVMSDTHADRADYLHSLVDAYLLKDILSIDGLKSASKMLDLLRLVAYQIGSEVSYDELGKQIGLSRNTVEKYLDLLSKVYVIYRVGGYARNLRKEVSKAGKWYFYDLGVRNAVINNFSPIAVRNDVGALWENYLISERIKRNHNKRLHHEFYFWKTYDRQEIDLVECADDSSIEAFEIKWGDKRPACPVAFASAYPNATFAVLRRDNYLDYIG